LIEFSTYKQIKKSTYYVRVLSAIVVAQLIVLAIIKFWPAQEKTSIIMSEKDFTEDVLILEDIVRTEQSGTPPPPPKPSVPIPEPTDEIIEEEINEINDIQYSVNTDSLSFQDIAGNEEGASNGGEIVNSPAQPAQIIRIVEAITPAAAKRASIKAEITVKMLVAKDGKVEDASIEEIRLYTGNDGYKIVDDIDYNLKKATLKAARQWIFEPAREEERPVRTYTHQIFNFGF